MTAGSRPSTAKETVQPGPLRWCGPVRNTHKHSVYQDKFSAMFPQFFLICSLFNTSADHLFPPITSTFSLVFTRSLKQVHVSLDILSLLPCCSKPLGDLNASAELMNILFQKRIVVIYFSVSRPLKDLVDDPPDYLDEICERLDASVTGVGSYKRVAKYYKFDMDTIFDFEKSPGGPSKALISAIIAKHPKVTVEMFASVVAMQPSLKDVAELLWAFDCK